MNKNNSRYLLYRKIAQGGMADIFLAKQFGEDGFQRVCCVKRILKEFAKNTEFVNMFRDEAHIGKRLQHANIVRIEGFEAIEDSYGMVMEYVLGADLKKILGLAYHKQSKPSIPMIAYIIAEAARGLHFAHTKRDDISQQPLGIVHRDISPQNILISFEGEVKVTDFGIADASKKNSETQVGMVKGKFSYMSPEQIRGLPVDPKTDVFALSVVFWELLALEKCFTGGSEAELIQNVLAANISKDIREIHPGVDEELYSILIKGLSKDPAERFGSAGDLERELRLVLSKKYAHFTPEDLGNYIKSLLQEHRQEALDRLRDLLMDTTKPEGWVEASGESGLSSDPTTPVVGNPSQLQSVSQSLKILDKARKDLPTLATHGRVQRSLSKGPRKVLKRERKQASSLFIKFFYIALLGTFVWSGYETWKWFMSKPFYQTVEVIPERAKIFLDGAPISDGRYLVTPFGVKIQKPGTHTLLIRRIGYVDERISIDAKPGSSLRPRKIALQASTKFAPVKAFLVSRSIKSAYIDIEDGLFVSPISSERPLYVRDLPYGQNLKVKVFAEEEGQELFQCVVTPTSTSWENPFRVVIDPKSRKCK